MPYARLIDVNYIKDNTTIDKNVDPKLITPAIDDAQNMDIQEVLGYELYQAFMSKVYDSRISPAGPDSIYLPQNVNYLYLLVNNIQQCQKFWVIYHILPDLNYHLTNKSVATKTSDSSDPSGIDQLSYLRNIAKSKAEFYATRIYEYIINNTGFYPEYWVSTGIGRILPTKLQYNDMIFTSGTSLIPTSGMSINNDAANGSPVFGCGYF